MTNNDVMLQKSPVLSDEDEVRDEDEADEDSDIFGESDKEDEDRKVTVHVGVSGGQNVMGQCW